MAKSFSLAILLLALVGGLMYGTLDLAAVTAVPAAGPTKLVSIHTNGTQGNGNSLRADVSANGRFVAFESGASTLVSGDTNNVSDVFVRDTVTNVTQRVSVHSNGTQANFASFAPAISDDGCVVAFYSYATNLVGGNFNNVPNAFVHDRCTGKTELVSVATGGPDDVSYDPEDPNNPNSELYPPDLSANGQYVVFRSFASNLIGGDSNGESDIFLRDLIGKTTQRVSISDTEEEAQGESSQPSISADGNRIAFRSTANNLVTGDAGGYADIFVRDRSAGTTQRVSISNGGNEAQGDSFEAVISGNGRYVVFSSLAQNLVSGDGNLAVDVFIRDTQANTTEIVSVATGGAQANDWCTDASVTSDGRYVAFQSRATTLVPGDPDNAFDVFVRDRLAATTVRASIDSNGFIGNGSSERPTIAANGRFVVFDSVAYNLVSGDNNGLRDVFHHDMVTPVPPPPPPTLSVNHPVGLPESMFTFTGANYAASQTYEIWINGVLITDTLSTAADGSLKFVILTAQNTAPGAYFATVVQGATRVTAGFMIVSSGSQKWTDGSGQILPLPAQVAPYTVFRYLPLAARN